MCFHVYLIHHIDRPVVKLTFFDSFDFMGQLAYVSTSSMSIIYTRPNPWLNLDSSSFAREFGMMNAGRDTEGLWHMMDIAVV